MSLAYRWPRKFETSLIEFLEKHPNYWDTKNRDYYNRTKRRQVLNNANKMLTEKGFSVDGENVGSWLVTTDNKPWSQFQSINKKFKNLRTMFTKEHKKKIKSQINNPENVYEPIWEHYNNLLFLQNAGTVPRTKKSKLKETGCELSSTDEDTVDITNENSNNKSEEEKRNFPEANVQQLDNRLPASITKPKSADNKNHRKRKYPNLSDDKDEPSNKIREFISSNKKVLRATTTTTIDDEPLAFGILVTHKLRRLSRIGQTKAQTEIMAILQKYVLAELDED